MKKILLILTFVVLHQQVRAQLSQPQRFEMKQKYNDDVFTIISLEEEGIALFRETKEYKEGKHSWQLILLDSALQQRVDTVININRNYNFTGHEYVAGKLNLLFQEGEMAKDKITLCTVNLQNFELILIDIKTELDLRLTHFSSLQNNVLFGGYINNEPAIVEFDIDKAKVKVVPGFLQKNTELLDLRVNENETFNVVLSEKAAGESKNIIFRTFDQQSKLLLEDIIPVGEGIRIMNAMTSQLKREDLLLVGTWGTRSTERALGFYSVLINPFEEQKINFTQFGSLQHYLDYLKPRRAQKIKNKTAAGIEKNKRYDYNNNVMLYKVLEHENGFAILGETYSSITSNTSPYYNNPYNSRNWNNPYPYNNPYFFNYPYSRLYRPMGYNDNLNNEDQIKTYASSILLIDEKGVIANDQSVKLEDVKLSSIQQVTDLSVRKNELIILYRKKSEIFLKRIFIIEDEAEELSEKIKLKDPFDELRDENEKNTEIRQWYGSTFYTWGYQTIRNINLAEDKTREVFYINKVVVH